MNVTKNILRSRSNIYVRICGKTTKHQRPKWVPPDRLTKRIPFSESDHAELTLRPPVQPKNPKNLKVSVIGMPNAGKSTLINALIGVEVLPTSSKIDTTVANCLGLLTLGDTQIEFVDSPGLFSRKSAIRNRNARSYGLSSEAMARSDLCLVVADLSSRRVSAGRLQPEILFQLLRNKTPSILVLNKIDRISHRSNVFRIIERTTAGVVDGRPCVPGQSGAPIPLPPLESVVVETTAKIDRSRSADEIKLENRSELKILNELRACSGWPGFDEVFVTSALNHEVVDELRAFLLARARPRQWGYHGDAVTDVAPGDLLRAIMRSSLLDNLGHEVPYSTRVRISGWHGDEDKLSVAFALACSKISHARIVARATKLLEFGARKRLQKLFAGEISIGVEVYFNEEPID